jgi:dolichyl-phosphate-mannose--protein O-mannosyl transferase
MATRRRERKFKSLSSNCVDVNILLPFSIAFGPVFQVLLWVTLPTIVSGSFVYHYFPALFPGMWSLGFGFCFSNLLWAAIGGAISARNRLLTFVLLCFLAFCSYLTFGLALPAA